MSDYKWFKWKSKMNARKNKNMSGVEIKKWISFSKVAKKSEGTATSREGNDFHAMIYTVKLFHRH